jgi:hypothetical protein
MSKTEGTSINLTHRFAKAATTDPGWPLPRLEQEVPLSAQLA